MEKTWIQKVKEELVASATLNKLEQIGVDKKRFLSSSREALLHSTPEATSALMKVVKAYGLAQSVGRKGAPIVAKYFEYLERRTQNLDRRSPYFKKLYDKTTSWVLEMASYGVIFKGVTDLTDRQRLIIDVDLEATGRLQGVLKLVVPQMEYEKAAVIGKMFNVDSEHVATAAFEFLNWYKREADMKDLKYIAAIARHTGQSFEDVWKQIQERTEDLGENFEQASYGVQDVVESQQELEKYQKSLGVPRENILGARDFAEVMKRVRDVSKDMPKDARVMNKVVVETLKRVVGTVDSKAAQEKMAEGMAKLLETDPLISEQLGVSVEKKIEEEASKIIVEHGGNFEKSKAESEAISKIFGRAYASTAQAIWDAYKVDQFDQFQSRRDLGVLYSKVPQGAAETIRKTIDFGTIGHTNPQTLMHYLRDKGVPDESIPVFLKMSTTGRLEEIAEAMTSLDSNEEAELKKGLKRRKDIIGEALPWLSDLLGTIRGGKEILLSSPFTKILGGVAALVAMNRFRKFQDTVVVAGINEVTAKLAGIAVSSGIQDAASLISSLPTTSGSKLGGALSLGRRLVGNRTVQALALAGTTAGAVYGGTRLLGGGEEAAAPKIDGAVADMGSNLQKSLVDSTPKAVESSTRNLTTKISESEDEDKRRRVARATPPARGARGVDEVDERDFVGMVRAFGDNKPEIEIQGFASRYVDAANKVANG